MLVNKEEVRKMLKAIKNFMKETIEFYIKLNENNYR